MIMTMRPGPVTVAAADSDAGVALTVSVDGADFVPYAGPFTITGDGVHTVEARGSDGADVFASVPIDGTAPTVTLSAGQLTVKLAAVAAEKTVVWAQVESGSGSNRQRHVFSEEIAQGDQEADFASTFAPGDWDVLALAAGAPPTADTQTV